eukprot:scaffold9301_cov30-Tisochrysis_lutea.AAC.14
MVSNGSSANLLKSKLYRCKIATTSGPCPCSRHTIGLPSIPEVAKVGPLAVVERSLRPNRPKR